MAFATGGRATNERSGLAVFSPRPTVAALCVAADSTVLRPGHALAIRREPSLPAASGGSLQFWPIPKRAL